MPIFYQCLNIRTFSSEFLIKKIVCFILLITITQLTIFENALVAFDLKIPE